MHELAKNAEHRLRIVEEDRDLLSSQAVALQRMLDKERRGRHTAQTAVALQRMLDKERRDRHTAQTAQQSAQGALRGLIKGDSDRAQADNRKVLDLQSKMDALKHRLAGVKKNGKGAAPEVIDSLQERTDQAEKGAATRSTARTRAEQEMVRKLAISLKSAEQELVWKLAISLKEVVWKLAISLKASVVCHEREVVWKLAISLKVLQLQLQFSDTVLQLQRQFSDTVILQKQRVQFSDTVILQKQRLQAYSDSARDESTRLREEEQQRDDFVTQQARRLDAVYAEENRMMRQLHLIKSDAAGFARLMRQEAARFKIYEEGLSREVQSR
ncbi:hypothetical protein T484DRAFT_1843366 [Baffinella frigidus]|nr:hypothetical protein T484DRAFT_1843366 [Cryptophyta sp. CCMP2293]